MKTTIKRVPRLKCSVCRHSQTCESADIHEDGEFPGCGISLRDPHWRGDDSHNGLRRQRKRPTDPVGDEPDDLMDA